MDGNDENYGGAFIVFIALLTLIINQDQPSIIC
jgi:hypothetical protein